MGFPTRREPQGNGVPIVVVRVTTLKARTRRSSAGRRGTGEPLEPDAATRNAERPKGEKRKLASRLPGNSYGRFARCADGKGRESGTSPAAYPTSNIRSRINN